MFAAGIDIGGTNSRFGLVDKNGRCTLIESVQTKNFRRPEELVKEISSRIFSKISVQQLAGIGVGAPNGNLYKGTIERAPNLPWRGEIPLAKLFQKETQRPCIVSNDANVAATGEMLFGKAKKLNDFIFITLGTGLGSGIVSGGKLVYGQNSLAGELGHVIVAKNGRRCKCGRRGCLETYVSATGIKRTVEEWLRNGKKSMLKKNGRALHAADIFNAAGKGDALAKKAFEFTGEVLGLALANSAVYTSPQVIFYRAVLQKRAICCSGPPITILKKIFCLCTGTK
jgi:glucokinase